MSEDLQIPWLDYNDIRRRADAFLARTNSDGTIPVPIDLIVEREGIDIWPLPGLQKAINLVGSIGLDGKIIYVDQFVYEYRENRYRFTVAHELGHLLLHGDLFGQVSFKVTDFAAWPKFTQSMSDTMYLRLEWQANAFAGLVLVPRDDLAKAFKRALLPVREMIAESERENISKQRVLDAAWDALTSEIAPVFRVSAQVIRIRLESDGFSAAQL